MALLPLPVDWNRARDVLGAVGGRAVRESQIPSDHELLELSLDAYGLRRRDVAALVSWSAR
jgi:hypothetical protein